MSACVGTIWLQNFGVSQDHPHWTEDRVRRVVHEIHSKSSFSFTDTLSGMTRFRQSSTSQVSHTEKKGTVQHGIFSTFPHTFLRRVKTFPTQKVTFDQRKTSFGLFPCQSGITRQSNVICVVISFNNYFQTKHLIKYSLTRKRNGLKDTTLSRLFVRYYRRATIAPRGGRQDSSAARHEPRKEKEQDRQRQSLG